MAAQQILTFPNSKGSRYKSTVEDPIWTKLHMHNKGLPLNAKPLQYSWEVIAPPTGIKKCWPASVGHTQAGASTLLAVLIVIVFLTVPGLYYSFRALHNLETTLVKVTMT